MARVIEAVSRVDGWYSVDSPTAQFVCNSHILVSRMGGSAVSDRAHFGFDDFAAGVEKESTLAEPTTALDVSRHESTYPRLWGNPIIVNRAEVVTLNGWQLYRRQR